MESSTHAKSNQQTRGESTDPSQRATPLAPDDLLRHAFVDRAHQPLNAGIIGLAGSKEPLPHLALGPQLIHRARQRRLGGQALPQSFQLARRELTVEIAL